ncbi:L-2-hydroxyglutarate oxidase [Georgenia halophila]|uniref:L-2-hydroxyglutarate oxidase n=1 Tax=Georgenia halophila TaxID=620889 RepID=A0ABP8LAR3_9MICO
MNGRERVVVVGGGLVGLATGLALQEQGRDVVVVEKEDGWAGHQSGHNSGVIHSGLYYRPGSLKARFATEAARTLPRLCAQWGVAARRTGKMVVATQPEELPRLRALLERGRANGIPVREIAAAEAREREPHVRCVGALVVDSAGVCDFVGLAQALAGRLAAGGAELRPGERVDRLQVGGRRVRVTTSRDVIVADHVVNCSGLHSDRLLGPEDRHAVRIIPFRGEYWTLRCPELVRGLIYPVPDPQLPFLGVHLTRGWDGRVHVGPNAVLALAQEGYRWRDVRADDVARTVGYPGLWRLARRHLRYGAQEVWRSVVPGAFLRTVRTLVPDVLAADLERSPAGVRAQAVLRDGTPSDDFVIRGGPHVTHVVNAPSPAATACLQIGRHVAEKVVSGS